MVCSPWLLVAPEARLPPTTSQIVSSGSCQLHNPLILLHFKSPDYLGKIETERKEYALAEAGMSGLLSDLFTLVPGVWRKWAPLRSCSYLPQGSDLPQGWSDCPSIQELDACSA